MCGRSRIRDRSPTRRERLSVHTIVMDTCTAMKSIALFSAVFHLLKAT